MAQKMRPETVTKQKLFLEAYRECGVVGTACRVAGVNRRTFYEWCDRDPAFKIMANEAYQDAVDAAEVELRRRAIHGVKEPVLYKGQPVFERHPDTGELILDEDGKPKVFSIQRTSDRLLEVYTRTHRPQYKEKSEVALTGPNGGPVESRVVFNIVKSNGDGKPEDGT